MSKQRDEETCASGIVGDPVDEVTASDLSVAFKALGDPVRLRLLSLIAHGEGGEVCVCDLTPRFDLAGPTISHHLKVLRTAGLIASERRGTWIHYRVVPARLAQLSGLLDASAAVPA